MYCVFLTVPVREQFLISWAGRSVELSTKASSFSIDGIAERELRILNPCKFEGIHNTLANTIPTSETSTNCLPSTP